jgi:hypothetical protein
VAFSPDQFQTRWKTNKGSTPPKRKSPVSATDHSYGEGGMTSLRKRHSSTLHIERPLKTVRITLPPSPPADEHEMEYAIHEPIHTRRSQRISDSRSSVPSTRVVLPTDSVGRVERFGSGSKWSHRDLALLKVKFEPHEDSELSVLDGIEWTASQRQSILALNRIC